MTEAPGAKMLKVVGVLMVIFGALGIIGGIMTLPAISLTVATLALLGISLSAGAYTVSVLIGIVSAIVLLIAGILGIKNATDVGKAGTLKSLGILCVILTIVNSVVGFIVLSALGVGAMAIVSLIFGLVLPILYVVGASKNAA